MGYLRPKREDPQLPLGWLILICAILLIGLLLAAHYGDAETQCALRRGIDCVPKK